MILNTTVVGAGEAIVFLHSGLQTGEIDFIYSREYFKDNYKVILPDLRGHGKSKVNNIDIVNFFNESAIDIEETLDSLHIDKVHIVGASLGALVGLIFTKRFSERVHSLTLSGLTPKKPLDWDNLQLVDKRMQASVLENEEAVHYFDRLHLSDWKGFLLKSTETDWYPFHETSDVSNIQCPTLFIVGEGKKHEVDGIRKYSEMDNPFHVCVLPFASHLVHNEQPELYTKVLEVFLEKVTK